MASDKPPAKVLPFARPRRFPADLDRIRRMLDDEDVGFEESDIDDGIACAEAAIEKSVPGAHEVLADLLNIRGHRTLAAGETEAALAKWAAIVERYPTYLPAYVARADVLGKRGEHDAALAEVDRYVERAPTEAGGYLQRARLYQARGDAERALANFRRAAQLDPTSTDAHLGVAQILSAKGDTHGAARAFAKAAEEVYDDVESYEMRGFMHFVSGQDELALADYEAAVALDPKNVDNIAWRGLCRLRLGRYDDAIADYTRVIAMRPTEGRGYRRRGEALVHSGKPVEALKDLERAIEIGGDDLAPAIAARGMAEEALGDVEAALASYDTALEKNPADVGARVRRFRIYSERGDWDKCQIDAAAMLARSPDNTSLLLAHARVCVAARRRDDALVAYERLIALEPNNVDAYKERAAIWVGKGDTLAAHADMARAYELAPNDPEIRAARGVDMAMVAKTDEDREAAYALIASSVELDPENPEAWARVGYRLRQVGQPAKALPFITRALEFDPDNVDYLDERAICLRGAAPPPWIDPEGHRAGLVASLAEIEKALTVADEEDLVELYRSRASLREDLGDIEGAIADHTKLMELAPDFLDPHCDRARLRKHMGDMAGALEDAAWVKKYEDELIADVPEAAGIKRFNLDEE